MRVETPADLARLRVVAVPSSIAAYWLEGLGIEFTGASSLGEAVARLARGECDAVVAPSIELRSATRGASDLVVGKAVFAEEYMCFGLSRRRGEEFGRRIDGALVARMSPAGGASALEAVEVAPLPGGGAPPANPSTETGSER